MRGGLQVVAAAMIVASAAATFARADEPNGLFLRGVPTGGSWTSIELGIAGLKSPAQRALEASERNTSAGTTVKRSGWRASLFVNSFGPRQTIDGDPPLSKSYSFVNARLTGDLATHAKVVFDVFNLFDSRVSANDYLTATRVWDQPAALDNFLFNPVEPRGFRVRLRMEF